MSALDLSQLCVVAVVFCFVLNSSHSLMRKRDIDEKRLNYDLFHKRKYNRLVRPVLNTSDSLRINFSLALSAIIDVDEKNQHIITNVWLQMYWYDYQLAWNPDDYGGIRDLRINNTQVWVPDVVLFNNADGKFEPSYNPNCVLNYTGRVKFIPPAIYTSSCNIDVKYFPFDQQKCEMKLGSWTFTGNTLNFAFQDGIKYMDLADYNKNGAWDIIDCQGHINQTNQIIVYDLVLRRKTLFYTVNLIIPCFLHSVACLCVFILPADGCEKTTLVISVLVSLVVFLIVVQKILPPSITVPLIARYFLFTIVMNVLEIFFTIIIININYRTPVTAVMPDWACWLFLFKLPKLMFMERPDHDSRWRRKLASPPPSYPSTPRTPRANTTETLIGGMKRNRQFEILSLSALGNSLTFIPSENGQSQSDEVKSDHIQHKRMNSCLSYDSRHSSSSELEIEPSSNAIYTNSVSRKRVGSKPSRSDDDANIQKYAGTTRTTPSSNKKDAPRHKPNPEPIDKNILSACNAVNFIWAQMKNKDDFETAMADWKYMAAVIDRLLMIIFVLVTFGGTVGVLVNAPHILETVDGDKILQDIINGNVPSD